MSNNQFTGTATQPQRNRKFSQFNKDQYGMCNLRESWVNVLIYKKRLKQETQHKA